jgi:hypothetical protein
LDLDSVSLTYTTGSVAAMVLHPDFSMEFSPGSPEQAMKLGWAHGALLTTFPGDTTMATLDQVRSFAQGGTARVQR